MRSFKEKIIRSFTLPKLQFIYFFFQSAWRVFASDPHRNFPSTWGKHRKYQVSIGHSNRNSVG